MSGNKGNDVLRGIWRQYRDAVRLVSQWQCDGGNHGVLLSVLFFSFGFAFAFLFFVFFLPWVVLVCACMSVSMCVGVFIHAFVGLS